MPPRLHVVEPLHVSARANTPLALPEAAARHARVLRLQPGSEVTLFDGRGGEWSARIEAMGKREVTATVLEHHALERELPMAATLALAMPSGERMDTLVEKATELGAAAIQPLTSERSVLRLSGDRAEKRRLHWQAIAIAACEQCGRNRVPVVHAVQPLAAWLGALSQHVGDEARWLLGWRGATPWAEASLAATVLTLSGPEGGFTADEEALAAARGFVTLGLGPRVLRADTAPLAVLAALSLRAVT